MSKERDAHSHGSVGDKIKNSEGLSQQKPVQSKLEKSFVKHQKELDENKSGGKSC